MYAMFREKPELSSPPHDSWVLSKTSGLNLGMGGYSNFDSFKK